MIEWINKNKITIGFVGGAIVIGSQWATCTVEPNLEPTEPQVEEVEGE